jgi:GNAT superfamily N-acetyltransferase
VEKITIRKATINYAAEIANVHINSWREAYKGLISDEYLNDRPLHFKNRYELWKKVTINEKQVTLVAESEEHGVVGFINGTHGRDQGYEDYVEVWCIYLLEKYHGKKIGFNLLNLYFDAHIKKGFSKGYLWVLDNNPTIRFYEKTGGQYNGQQKEDNIAGKKVKELCYIWEDIQL